MKKVIESSKLLEEVPQKVTIGELDVALFRLDNNVYALDDLCTHAEASLSEGEIFDCKVECPLHEGYFHLDTGTARMPPAEDDALAYSVKIIGDDISVGPKES